MQTIVSDNHESEEDKFNNDSNGMGTREWVSSFLMAYQHKKGHSVP